MSSILLNKSSTLISSEALQYIRPMEIEVKAKLLKPNTRVYAFLDEMNVSKYFQPSSGLIGDPLITSSTGSLSAIFHVPGMTIHTGDKQLVITDNDVLSNTTSNSVFASTRFKSLNSLNLWTTKESSESQLSVKLIERRKESLQVSRPTDSLDPIVQSFFTYNVTGGCFVTSISVFFSQKDTTTHPLPVWLEVRELVNGFPGSEPINQNAIVVVEPSSVSVTGETKFIFSDLLYLEENRDYCFVIQSMSNKYKLLSAKLSDITNETGNPAFNTPYIGAMYRKENGNVWSKKENESLKFKLNKAKFDSNVNASIRFSANTNPITINSTNFYTTIGSSEIILGLQNRHGLTEGKSFISVQCDTNGNYNGIPGNILSGSFIVNRVINDYSLSFIVDGYKANITGPIWNSGRINNIQVDEAGEGYTSTPTVTIYRTNSLETKPELLIINESYTITQLGTTTDWNTIVGTKDVEYEVGMIITPVVTGSGDGVASLNAVSATARAVINDGKINSIIIDNPGSGYFSLPTVVITSQQRPLRPGRATVVLDDVFFIKTNSVFNAVNPVVNTLQPSGTAIDSKIECTRAAFDGGSFISGENAGQFDFSINEYNRLQSNVLLTSDVNGLNTTTIDVNLYSINSNVSPVISANSRAVFVGNSINNQRLDNASSTDSSGMIDRVVVVSGGAGYTVKPTLRFTNSNGEILDVTSDVTIGSGQIQSISIISQNFILFDEVPNVTIIGGGTVTTPASLQVIMKSNGFNTELFSNDGRALSRYISKKQILANVSSGIRLYLLAYSNQSSSIDVYIKSGLSSSEQLLDSASWKQLSCQTSRNRSLRPNEKLEYSFSLDNIDPFDTYQIKIVLRSTTPWDPPVVYNYRSIIIV